MRSAAVQRATSDSAATPLTRPRVGEFEVATGGRARAAFRFSRADRSGHPRQLPDVKRLRDELVPRKTAVPVITV